MGSILSWTICLLCYRNFDYTLELSVLMILGGGSSFFIGGGLDIQELVSWLVLVAFIPPSLVGLFYFALIPRLLGYRGRCSGRVRIVGPGAGGEDHLYFLGRR
jgi:hypothetical protein